MTPLLLLGIGIFLLGVFVLIWPQKWDSTQKKRDYEMPGRIEDHIEEESEERRCGAVIMIGPIPIVMGSDPRMAALMMALSLAIMILWIILIKGL
jgi:uncharacterized protein (TIGR00304 family)